MATEEVNKPPSLPPYPEMIFEALDALKEKDGSNRTSISKYIESKCGDLPAGHSNLLSHHLNKLKDSGELVFLKNNYSRPDPNAPPKRGRGRPPKPKVPTPPGAVIAPARPRGRPRKDPNAPSPPKKVSSSSDTEKPSGGGGPPKVAQPSGISGGSTTTTSKTGRPRGRPPKVKTQMAEVGVQGS